jgi:hypothetical protein
MTRALQAILIIICVLATLAMGYHMGHLSRVIHDQREYMDLGCKGYYQGEDQ